MKPPSQEDGSFCLGYVACLRALALEGKTVPAACRWFAQCANTPEAQARASHAEEEQKTARRLRNGGEGDGATAAQRRQLEDAVDGFVQTEPDPPRRRATILGRFQSVAALVQMSST